MVGILLLLLLAAGLFRLRVGEVFCEEVNAFPGVTMTAVEGTASSTGITVEVLNTTALDISSGNEALLGLQMELGGQWYWLNAFPGGITTTLEAYLYRSGRPRELELDWGPFLWPPVAGALPGDQVVFRGAARRRQYRLSPGGGVHPGIGAGNRLPVRLPVCPFWPIFPGRSGEKSAFLPETPGHL